MTDLMKSQFTYLSFLKPETSFVYQTSSGGMDDSSHREEYKAEKK